jgi:hypothetical protein
MYFFIKFLNKREFILPLLASSFLLILSHHFTTYFYIICITFIFFSYLFSKNSTKINNLNIIIYVSLVSALAFGYWAIVAKPVYYSFIQGNMFFSPHVIIILYYLFLFGGFFLIQFKKEVIKNIFSYKLFSSISRNRKIFLIFLILLILSLYSMLMGIPGVYVRITPLALIYSLPMIVLVSLSFTGFSDLKKTNGGLLILGWSFALLLSFLYSIIFSNLLPDRHLEYLIVPLCIPAAIIINDMLEHKSDKKIKKISQRIIKPVIKHPHINVLALVFVCIMCISNMMVAYPTINALNTIDERVTQPCLNSIEWMDGNISKKSVIASDHRLSMILWAEGYNITYSETNYTWTAENLKDCYNELVRLDVNYIVIDDIMKNTVINVDIGKYYYLNNESYDKFSSKPFDLIYRNATINTNGDEVHWIEIYKFDKYYGFFV